MPHITLLVVYIHLLYGTIICTALDLFVTGHLLSVTICAITFMVLDHA